MKINDITRGRGLMEAGGTITLYHGTSSALIGLIRQEGLIAMSTQDVFQRLREIAEAALGGALPSRVIAALRRHASGYKTPTVYLTTSADYAVSYARAYAKTGGELGNELLTILKEEAGFQGDALFPDARPVVVEVTVPAAWVKRESPTSAEVLVHQDIPVNMITKVMEN